MPIRHDLPLRHAPRQADETRHCTKHDEETLLRMRFQAIEPAVIERPIPSAPGRPQAGPRLAPGLGPRRTRLPGTHLMIPSRTSKNQFEILTFSYNNRRLFTERTTWP